jgi:Coenzyme PQQ synthesis protein D (PqqD)
MELEASTIVSRAPEVVFERVDDRVLVLDPGGSYVRLNGTGSELWGVLDTPTSIEGLARHLASTRQVDAERAQADVLSFVEGLHDRRLVQCTAG